MNCSCRLFLGFWILCELNQPSSLPGYPNIWRTCRSNRNRRRCCHWSCCRWRQLRRCLENLPKILGVWNHRSLHITQFLSFPNVLQLYWVALSLPMKYFPMLPGFCWSLQSYQSDNLRRGSKPWPKVPSVRRQRGDIEKSRDLSMISKNIPEYETSTDS